MPRDITEKRAGRIRLKQIPALRENTENLKVNVDNVELLPVSAENALRDFNETGVEDIDFAEYSDEVRGEDKGARISLIVSSLRFSDQQTTCELRFDDSRCEFDLAR